MAPTPLLDATCIEKITSDYTDFHNLNRTICKALPPVKGYELAFGLVTPFLIIALVVATVVTYSETKTSLLNILRMLSSHRLHQEIDNMNERLLDRQKDKFPMDLFREKEKGRYKSVIHTYNLVAGTRTIVIVEDLKKPPGACYERPYYEKAQRKRRKIERARLMAMNVERNDPRRVRRAAQNRAAPAAARETKYRVLYEYIAGRIIELPMAKDELVIVEGDSSGGKFFKNSPLIYC